jgi:hypothetical protein
MAVEILCACNITLDENRDMDVNLWPLTGFERVSIARFGRCKVLKSKGRIENVRFRLLVVQIEFRKSIRLFHRPQVSERKVKWPPFENESHKLAHHWFWHTISICSLVCSLWWGFWNSHDPCRTVDHRSRSLGRLIYLTISFCHNNIVFLARIASQFVPSICKSFILSRLATKWASIV